MRRRRRRQPHQCRAHHRHGVATLMRPAWTDVRAVVSLAGTVLVGVLGLQIWSFPVTDPMLALVAAQRPALYRVLLYGYATLCLSTPFVLLHALASSCLSTVADRCRCHARPHYPLIPIRRLATTSS